ncbi:hypothetical protein LCGC14_1385380 [marine sediment metagenome]|uniref:DUF6876 domain-containing protein n=1 Tax=marine sediment metagenome TaxID=412755 RepID=A0A0F9KME5_9ZZZZ
MKTEQRKDDLNLSDIDMHSGTFSYIDVMGSKVTEGIGYIMQNGYSWVVTDALVILKMNKKVRAEEFVVVKLKVKDGKATIVYEDGNDNILFKQKYKITNARKDLKLYYTNGVLMLQGEY